LFANKYVYTKTSLFLTSVLALYRIAAYFIDLRHCGWLHCYEGNFASVSDQHKSVINSKAVRAVY